MMPSQRIEDVIRSVRLTTSAATDERITAAGQVAMAKRNEQRPASVHTGAAIRRIIMDSKWTKLATAAVIVVAAVLGMYALTGSVDVASITMAQVRQAMEGIDWMQIILRSKIREGVQTDWYSFASKVEIKADEKGRFSYSDFKTRKDLFWPGEGNFIYESLIETREFAHGASGPFEMIEKTLGLAQAQDGAYGAEIVKKLGTYQGHKVEIWTASHVRRRSTRTIIVYIDIDKKLPIAATYEREGTDSVNPEHNYIEFKYPETGPADVYEAGAPRSAQIRLSAEG
jgi:hypothetical protein